MCRLPWPATTEEGRATQAPTAACATSPTWTESIAGRSWSWPRGGRPMVGEEENDLLSGRPETGLKVPALSVPAVNKTDGRVAKDGTLIRSFFDKGIQAQIDKAIDTLPPDTH